MFVYPVVSFFLCFRITVGTTHLACAIDHAEIIGPAVLIGSSCPDDEFDFVLYNGRGKYRIRRFIFVGDRGLFSRKNLDALRGKDKVGEFIVGMKLGVFKERHAEFYDISRYSWINDSLAIYETTHEGDRCIVTWSRARADRDKKAREDILDKIRKKLSKKKIINGVRLNYLTIDSELNIA